MFVRHATGSYPIHIGSGLLDQAGELLKQSLAPDSRHVIVVDEKVASYDYFDRVKASLEKSFPTWAESNTLLKHVVPAGEATKSIDNVAAACQRFVDEGIDRRSTIIALGGGVTGDLAGFVAASFLRGVNFVQIPTTLLAQVDSSVGGKTGVNLPNAKNSVGAFWQPKTVLIDPQVLKTLEPKEFTAGLGEVVKYGVIMDEPFFEYLEENADAINELHMPTLERVVTRCCELKAKVVEEDELETLGRRQILNYGHTFGHAIESVFGYGTYPHGYAVAMGMHAAAHLAKLLGRVEHSLIERQSGLLSALKVPTEFPSDRHSEILGAMQRDKKTFAGDVRFLLPTKIGHVDLVKSVDKSLILESMKLASG